MWKTVNTRKGSIPLRLRTLRLDVAATAAITALLRVSGAEDPDVVSPLVSYQFIDGSADLPVEANIVSPLVSYQFLDWPGDDNLTFESSVPVSYFFGGGLSLDINGTVRDAAGLPLEGAEVLLQRHNAVFRQGISAADGSLPTFNLPAGNFNVIVIKAGYTSLFQSVPGEDGGSMTLNLILQPELVLPTLATVTRAPEPTAIGQVDPPPVHGVRAANLKVFDGTSFVPHGTLHNDRMTIVITHGWNPGGGDQLGTWMTTMADRILDKHSLGGLAPNLVAWSWGSQAGGAFPPVDRAALQGDHLGRALYMELGPDYAERIHFIGHSLGTIVNAGACDYLHGWVPRASNRPPSPWHETATRPHLTLLDQAEVANVLGSFAKTSTISSWFDAQSRSDLLDVVTGASSATSNLGYKSPFPRSAAWMDSYNTQVGLIHPRVVNVRLEPPSIWRPITNHSSAHLWYSESVRDVSGDHALGFNRAFERSGLLPPPGASYSPGQMWIFNGLTVDSYDFVHVDNPAAFQVLDMAIRAEAIATGTTIGSIGALGDGVLSRYEAGLEWVGDVGGTIIHKTGLVATEVSEKIGNLWDAAMDQKASVNPDMLFTGSIAAPTWKLLLRTPSASQPSIRNLPKPPQAWFPVQVPANAGFLVFDITVTGDPADDVIVCAANEENLFTLPARFAPDNSPVSTDFLDISKHVGQEVELYFGLVGGTSHGCTLAIDGIRFVTIPTPQLSAEALDERVILTWPAAATGWWLQRSENLSPESWEDVLIPETIEVVDGVVILERARTPEREFFRLKRD